MNGSPHGPLPPTPALTDEQRWRAALYVAGWLTGRYSHAEVMQILDMLDLRGIAGTGGSPQIASKASGPRNQPATRARAGRPRTPSQSLSNDPARTTSTTEERS